MTTILKSNISILFLCFSCNTFELDSWPWPWTELRDTVERYNIGCSKSVMLAYIQDMNKYTYGILYILCHFWQIWPSFVTLTLAMVINIFLMLVIKYSFKFILNVTKYLSTIVSYKKAQVFILTNALWYQKLMSRHIDVVVRGDQY